MKRALIIVLSLLFFVQCSATTSRRSLGETLDDSIVATKIRTKLMKSESVPSHKIKLTVWRGIASLKGVLKNQSQIDTAIELTEKTSGVKQVKSYLVLQSMAKMSHEKVDHGKKKKGIFGLLKPSSKSKSSQTSSSEHVVEVDLPNDTDHHNKTQTISDSFQKSNNKDNNSGDFEEVQY